MKQVFHHYKDWEEHHHGLWRKVSGAEKEEYLSKAVEFTGNTELYGDWMMKVISEWPVSCEQNLTCSSINRQAWVGHAACCLAIGCPEEVTRLAWWKLTDKQRDEANLKADEAIAKWEEDYRSRNQFNLFWRDQCLRKD